MNSAYKPPGSASALKINAGLFLSFKGRINRKTYFWREVFIWLMCGFIYVQSKVLGYLGEELEAIPYEYYSYLLPIAAPAFAVALVIVLLSILFALADISLCLRRLHDMNRRGWWYLLGVPAMFTAWIPSMTLSVIFWVVNIGFILWLVIGKGSPGANRFGEAPDSPAEISLVFT